MLEHHADATAHGTQCVFAKAGDFAPFDQDRTGIRLFKAVDATDQRGLARAAATDDAENFAARDGKRNAVDSCRIAEHSAHVFHLDDGR